MIREKVSFSVAYGIIAEFQSWAHFCIEKLPYRFNRHTTDAHERTPHQPGASEHTESV